MRRTGSPGRGSTTTGCWAGASTGRPWAGGAAAFAAPEPIIIGHLPAPAPDTSPILSPQWVEFVDPAVLMPDLWRGNLDDFFYWLATDNGAMRLLEGRFGVSSTAYNTFMRRAERNPGLVLPPG